jgi:hypothetical protein
MNKNFENWWLINKFRLMEDDDVGVREIALAAYTAGKEDAEHSAQTTMCRGVNHYYIEGVCAQCGTKERPDNERKLT